jgi:hypothetical protein
MQEPNEHDEALIPTEIVSDGPNLNRAVKEGRKAAKRTLPWDLAAGELDLVSPQPRAEDIPARKKRRLEEPFSASTEEAASTTASPDVLEGLSPPAADIDDANANADPSTDTQPNAGGATRATRRWTLEEDANLTRAVANTSKKIWGKEYKTNWPVISELIPGRTNIQCWQRWNDVLDPSIGRASGRKGRWTAVEDSKLKDTVQTQGDKDWGIISALVPGRTKEQCNQRWHYALKPSIALTAGRKGKWTAVEVKKLKDAVQTHGSKNWSSISALVPGRTKHQCSNRWYDVLDPSIDRANGRTGKWTAAEDSKLMDAIQTHGTKDWAVISALVPGRTRSQCNSRWHKSFNPSIVLTAGRTGKWAEDEDIKLKDVVHTYGDKDWDAISALVLGRTKTQCMGRWKKVMGPNRGTFRGKEHGTLKKAPGLGQNPHSP